MEKTPFIINGIFTDELRKKLEEKRLALGLTYFKLGNFLGVNWSTIRKWEKGLTASCNCSQRGKFMDFINGEYDQALKLRSQTPNYAYSVGLPDSIQMCMEKLTNTYLICRNSDDLQRALIQKIDKITGAILMEMAGSSDEEQNSGEQDQNPDRMITDEDKQLKDFLKYHC